MPSTATLQPPTLKTAFTVVAVFLCYVLSGHSQITPTEATATHTAAASSASTDSAPTLSKREIAIQNAKNAIEAIAADTELDETVRTQQTKAYTDAIQHLQNAQSNAAKSVVFKTAAKNASSEIATTKLQLLDLPTVQQARVTSRGFDLDELNQQAEAARSRLAELNQSKTEQQQTLEQLEVRPQEVTSRLSQANSELNTANAALTVANAEDKVDLSKQALLAAQQYDITTEIEMLKQEADGLSDQTELRNYKLQLILRQTENTKAKLDSLDLKLNRARMSEAERVVAEVTDLAQAAQGKGPLVEELAAEVTELALSLKEAANQLQLINKSFDEIVDRTSQLNTRFTQFEREINLGGLDGILSNVYIEQRRALPNPQQIAYSIKQRAATLKTLRLSEFALHERILNQKEYAKQFSPPLEAEVAALLEKRQELLNDLTDKQRDIFRYTNKVDQAERDYATLLMKVKKFFREKLFWKRSSPPLWEVKSIDFPGAASWIMGSNRLAEIKRGLLASLTNHRYHSGIFAIIFLSLLLYRPRLKDLIKDRNKRIKNTSTDCFANTWWAALGTVLLSLPVPLLIQALSWILSQDPESSDWLQGITRGLHWCSIIAAWTCFLIACCSSSGLGINHFGWNAQSTKSLRRSLYSFLMICIPSMLIVCSMVNEETSLHFDSVGRICFIFILIWAFWVLKRLLRPRDGLMTWYHHQNSNNLESKTAPVWSLLLLASPIILIILTLQGFFITSLVLTLELLAIIGLITFGCICYYFALRWFMIKERKLALAEAIKERNERIEAARKKEEPEQAGEAVVASGTPELDLEKVGQQTRRMLRSLFTIAVMVGIWFLVTRTLPVDEALGNISFRGWLKPLDLFYASAILTIMTVVVKNLPGLLELSGLRESNLDVGARYAITTISQYIVGSIGLALTCSVLHVNWSMFGWIATALSVGLGFGLQEIVSNFVCGIILLFERPIRIGDIITINNVTGTVTRIQMRATTILNWDRQELIVPNKQFISDALINWTLTNAVNRVIITVGVAYGTDTIRAKKILTDIAKAHPLVLEDPEPLATFEEFGDSALTLRLRAYLPDLSNRIHVITDLHDTIDQRFKAAGIEIAFPQQDLHIRSIDDSILKQKLTGQEPSKS